MSRRVQRRWRRWAVYWAVTIGLQPMGTWSATKSMVAIQQSPLGASNAGGGSAPPMSSQFVISTVLISGLVLDPALVDRAFFICSQLRERCAKAAPEQRQEKSLQEQYEFVRIHWTIEEEKDKSFEIRGDYDIHCHQPFRSNGKLVKEQDIAVSGLQYSCGKRKECEDRYAAKVIDDLRSHKHVY